MDRERRYWAMRTDNNYQKDLFNELQQGRLRQGWGYDNSQDLRTVQLEINKGGSWWERISEMQRQVLPHLRMLGEGDDSIKAGDTLLLPKLPENSLFSLVEVTGSYYFEIFDKSEDHGHVLPVKLLTPKGINKFNESVDARIRSTLRAQNRLWSVDSYKDYIHSLIDFIAKGRDLTTTISGPARLNSAWEIALANAKELLHEKLSSELDARFRAAEWEEPIVIALNNLYPGLDVNWTAGAGEMGADVVVQIPNLFDNGLPWLILIQIANYSGQIGAGKLVQIEQAYNSYSKQGKVLTGVIMTTAESASQDFDQKKIELETKLGIPIKLICRKELIDIMTEGLSARITEI